MYFNWKKKVGSLLLAFSLIAATTAATPVFAAADNIEIVLTDVTQDDETTLLGEAKIRVSVKGAGGSVSAVQTALEFSGDLKYKSIEFLQGENNPPECFFVPPNAALANSTGRILPGIVTNTAGKLTFTDDETPLFIITFAGDPGESITLGINNESEAGTYCAVDGSYITTGAEASATCEAVASEDDNEGVAAVVKLVMNLVDDFTVSTGEGYADSKLTLTITNEKTGSTINTVLNTVSSVNGGHYDSTVSVPTFVVENTVVAGDTYTVELKGSGYADYRLTGVDFSEDIVITNAEFVPGDVNSDGKVDADDKAAFDLAKNGEYTEYADLNRNGIIDSGDDVFEALNITAKTAPAKMAKPTVTGGANQITVSWTAPDNRGADITGYVVKYGTSATNLDKTEEITDPAATSKVIIGLNAATAYYVQIAAKNEIGTGEFSDTASATTGASISGSGSSDSSGGAGGGGAGGGGASGGGASGGGASGGGASIGGGAATGGGAAAQQFTDLGNYGWASTAIYQLKNKGIISGVSATEYAPQNNIKRGDFILILTRMLTINATVTDNFADVPAGSYYYNAIAAAKAAGIAQGSGNSFMPENTITRQDLITLAYRAFLDKGYITASDDVSSLDAFADKDKIADYAKTAMASMVKAGIIQGSDGNVNPLGYATRAEVAVMCSRLMELVK